MRSEMNIRMGVHKDIAEGHRRKLFPILCTKHCQIVTIMIIVEIAL
jgi:hypothetical protein